MKSRMWDLVGPMTGIIFVVLLVFSIGTNGSVRDDLDSSITRASADEAAKVLVERRDQATTSGYIGLFGLAFFFGFLAYFRSRLQRAEGEGGWLTSMAYGGGLVTAAVMLVFISLNLATTAVWDYGSDTQVAKTLIALQWRYVWVFAPPMIAFTLGASLVIVRFGALPRWVGWIGLPVSVTLLVPWIGEIAALGWILLVSIVLLIQAWRAPRPEEAS